VKVTDTRGKWRGLNLFLFSAKFLPPFPILLLPNSI
jgi:hypothetical protein